MITGFDEKADAGEVKEIEYARCADTGLINGRDLRLERT